MRVGCSTLRMAIALALALAPLTGHAQPVAPGARIRLTLAGSGDQRVGNVISMSGQQLVAYLESGDTVRVSPIDVDRLEIAVGSRRHFLLVAGIGLVAGAVTGAIAGAATPVDSRCTFMCAPRANVVYGAAIVAMFGTAIGGVVGLLHTTDVWRLAPFARTGLRIRTDVARQRIVGSIAL